MDYQLLISIPLIKEEILPKRLKLNKRFEDCFLKDLYFYINSKTINKKNFFSIDIYIYTDSSGGSFMCGTGRHLMLA